MTHAHMSVQTGQNNGVDAELSEEKVKVGVEETAVASLGNNVVALANFELGDNLCSLGARYCVVAPELELVVNALEVSVVAENDGDVLLSRTFDELCGLGDYRKTSVALERAGYKIVEHINDENRILLFHDILQLLIFID